MMKRLILLLSLVALANFTVANAGVIRHAIIAGANDGGQDRVTLKYATKDAQSIFDVFSNLGGLSSANTQLLIEPNADTLRQALATAQENIASFNQQQALADENRVEFIFYYSGHSDEKALLLGEDHVSYTELKTLINEIDADVTVAILDSCASGAFTRLKGGQHVKPFLVNSAAQVSGYAYLASSSEDEAAQESDAIEGAYFTHYMVSALRGAGDLSEDRKITLNEAYNFAFNETLARTEGSQHGAQHPAYNIQLSGEGDLVLTDLNKTSGELMIAETVLGRLYIRDAKGNLMVELSKNDAKPLKIGLEPGEYRITLERDGEVFRVDRFEIIRGISALDMASFEWVSASTSVARGQRQDAAMGSEAVEDVSVKWSFTELNSSPPTYADSRQRVNWDFNLFGNKTYTIDGLSAGAFLTKTEQDTKGVQIAGLYNEIGGNLQGVAFSGLLNHIGGNLEKGFAGTGGLNLIRGETREAFVAGSFNIATQPVERAFMGAGVLNYTPSLSRGGQAAGAVNIVLEAKEGAQISGAVNLAKSIREGAQITGAVNGAVELTSGAQIAGALNMVDQLKSGTQIAGAVNVARDIDGGAQIGTVNVAKTINGSQIGIINIAAQMQGEPIGLINLIGNGRHSSTLRYNERRMPTAEIKLGGQRTYSEWSFGHHLDDQLISFGYAFGIRMMDFERHFLEVDLGHQQYLKQGSCWFCNDPDATDESALRLRFSLGQKVTNHINLVAGVSINGSVDFWNEEWWSHQPIEDFKNEYLENALWVDNGDLAWVGYSFGIEIN